MAEESVTQEAETPTETPEAASQPATEPTTSQAEPTPEAATEAAPEPTSPYWAEDWRETLAGKNSDELKTLNRYKDPTGIWRAYKALRSRMDSGDLKPSMPDPSDEEAMASWRKEAGIPETVDGYFENLPEGMEITDADRPLVEDYFSRMHSLGVAPAATHEGLRTLFDAQRQIEEQRAQLDAQQKQALDDELYSAYGAEKNSQIGNMEDTLFHNDFYIQAPDGLRDKLERARFDDGTKVLNDADFVNWMVQTAAVINPGGTTVPQTGVTQRSQLDSRIAEIENVMRTNIDEYYRNPQMVSEYGQLLETRDKLAARQ